LFHKRNDKNIEAVDEYLQSLYNFTTFVASYHKPCITVSNGITQGAGAAFLSSINFPCVTHNTTVSYPETNYGLNPHAGNIYFLSRMKGEIGTFLALTGYVLKGSDLV
jgi:enoyl-CoA hydratase/carnithine racemase